MDATDHCVSAMFERIGRALIFLVLFVGLASTQSGAQNAPRRVLMLHAYNYSFPATTQVGEAARKRLLQYGHQKIQIDADFLDLARITDPSHEERMAEFLREKYARTPPDVVMTLGSA